jgi:adenylylsulfate kinase-like enzyme
VVLRSVIVDSHVAVTPCVWLTGRRGAGKRTIAALAAGELHAHGRRCAVLDAEALTEHLSRGPTDGGLTSLAWLANLLTGNGVPVIVTADAPKRADRELLRESIAGFVEVFVDAPADVCAARSDVADHGYEEPIAPALRVPTGDRDARASAALLLSYLEAATPPNK